MLLGGFIVNKDISEILISEEQITDMVYSLAKQINSDYNGRNLLLIGFLKGACVFLSDLMRKIDLPCAIEFVQTASYGDGAKSKGSVDIVKDISRPLQEYDVLLVEDIIDSGITLSNVYALLQLRDPKSLKICTFLNKPARREKEVEISYIGFEIPNEFVVGYGMDYNEKYRNLPYIGTLKREIYS